MQWETWYRSNVISTAMESAALFVISSIRNTRAGEILAIIGLTHNDTPIIAKIGVEDAVKVGIEAVRTLIKQDKRG